MGPYEAALRKSYVAYDEGNIEAVLEGYAEDATIFAGGDPKILIYAGTWVGRHKCRQFFVEARNKQTGKTATSWKIDLIRFRNGKCTYYAEYKGTAVMQAATV